MFPLKTYHFCLNVQFTKIKLVWRIELRRRRSWSCESWSWCLGLLWIQRRKEFYFWDVTTPAMLIYNKRETEGFHLLHKHQWKSKPFHFNVFLIFLRLIFFGCERHDLSGRYIATVDLSRETISCFRAEGHLVFHWWL